MFSAVIKHDGRRVAFDSARLEASVLRAAMTSVPADAAARLAREVAAIEHDDSVVRTADLRAFVTQTLRSMNFEAVADAYQQHTRETLAFIQRVRVVEPEMPRMDNAGLTWDRRRLSESMRASGIAPDLAGAIARGVERRIVTLELELISPALIHALTMLALPHDAFGARAYGSRRVAFAASQHLPHVNAHLEGRDPLPSDGIALQQFWLQGVHSPEVVKAVRDNFLALDPCPSTAGGDVNSEHAPSDPLSPDFSNALTRCFESGSSGMNVRADTPERIGAIAAMLSRGIGEPPGVPAPGTALSLYFKSIPKKLFDAAHRALPVTLNAGGLVAREAVRDPKRAAARLGELAAVAARVHREREEYFLRSPVRGRVLPIAVAGLWNATAWLQGEGFDTTHAAIGARRVIAPLCQSLRAAVEALRLSSGMDLVLTASAPVAAERRLWRDDRSFFLNDGLKLNAASAYESGPELKLSSSMDDFFNRLDFATAVGEAFDEPPVMSIDAAVSVEVDSAQWNDLFAGLAQAGVACLRVAFGGSARAVPNLTRAIRSYLIGFPLLDGLDEKLLS